MPFFILWFSILILPILTRWDVFFGDYSPHTKIFASFMSTGIWYVFSLHSKNFFGQTSFLASSNTCFLHSYLFLTKKVKSLTHLTYDVAVLCLFWQPFDFWILWTQDVFICDLLIIIVLQNQARSSFSFPDMFSKIIIYYLSLKTQLVCTHNFFFWPWKRFSELYQLPVQPKFLPYYLNVGVSCLFFEPHLYFIE